MTRTADTDFVEYLPLRPKWRHLLRNGWEAAPGQPIRRHRPRNPDEGLNDWDGTYVHQSNESLVWRLLVEIKSQGVWDIERAWAELTRQENLGGRWLRDQDDPRSTFDDMWNRAYQHHPMLSLEQVAVAVLALIREKPGIRLRDLRAAIPFNRGNLESILSKFIADGTIVQEREMSPSGARCLSRRFWFHAAESPTVLARRATRCVSMALLGLGHRNPEGSMSFHHLIEDRRLRSRGVREFRRLLRLKRGRPPRKERPTDAQPAACDLDWDFWDLLDGTDLLPDSTSAVRRPPPRACVAGGSARGPSPWDTPAEQESHFDDLIADLLIAQCPVGALE